MNKIERQAIRIIEIRAFEETLLELFSSGVLSGTTHTCIGQEATAVAVMEYITPEDKIFSNHRCHGHYLAYGGPMDRLLAEIMSRNSGLCQGRGGSQHIHYKNFHSNGVQGGIVPNAVGMALADKLRGKPGVTVVFMGDGTLGQGVVYESFNMASLWECPNLFVIEDNGYAMSTPRAMAVGGEIALRPAAFGIQTSEISGTDVTELDAAFADAFSYIRTTGKPFCQIVHNYRLGPHSKGDDLRDSQEIAAAKRQDPLVYVRERLGDEFLAVQYARARERIQTILGELESEGQLSVREYAVEFCREHGCDSSGRDPFRFFNTQNRRVVSAIHDALSRLLAENPDVVLLGEDIRDPYGGAFKITKGLSPLYPDRVINTPISEAGVAGVGVGLALNGMTPIIEIMFGDFISLCFDQLLNHAVKYPWVYGGDVSAKVVFRLPSGAGRGYGPTHSQSLEKYLIGIPLLTVVALTDFLDVEELCKNAVEFCRGPLVLVENKKMYAEREKVYDKAKIGDFFIAVSAFACTPMLKLSLDPEAAPDVTLITYGGMAHVAADAAEQLMIDDEIQVDIVLMTQLAPFPLDDFRALFLGTQRSKNYTAPIVFLEEGNLSGGVGAQITARLLEQGIGGTCSLIAAEDSPIPNGIALENQLMPGVGTVMETIRKILKEK